MEELEGVIAIQRDIGSDILVINDIPISKFFSKYDGEVVELTIKRGSKLKTYKGTADIFYFEGKQEYYRGIKYANDFLLDEMDILELLEEYEGDQVRITLTSGE